MEISSLSQAEKRVLLVLARESLECNVRGEKTPELDLHTLPPRLRAHGASFVTLTIDGELRGCVGALEAYQPLALDVREHAAAAALQDPRFPPVGPGELSGIKIEVSRLTAPVDLQYASGEELPGRLRPHIDGVILRDGFHRATFLPQVWEKIPDPEDFLDNLCSKMGAVPGLWRHRLLTVQIYQVEEFCE
ncbi:MAG: AmmeMemoRadiSam system protein A [Chloroflexota bacterium]